MLKKKFFLFTWQFENIVHVCSNWNIVWQIIVFYEHVSKEHANYKLD